MGRKNEDSPLSQSSLKKGQRPRRKTSQPFVQRENAADILAVAQLRIPPIEFPGPVLQRSVSSPACPVSRLPQHLDQTGYGDGKEAFGKERLVETGSEFPHEFGWVVVRGHKGDDLPTGQLLQDFPAPRRGLENIPLAQPRQKLMTIGMARYFMSPVRHHSDLLRRVIGKRTVQNSLPQDGKGALDTPVREDFQEPLRPGVIKPSPIFRSAQRSIGPALQFIIPVKDDRARLAGRKIISLERRLLLRSSDTVPEAGTALSFRLILDSLQVEGVPLVQRNVTVKEREEGKEGIEQEIEKGTGADTMLQLPRESPEKTEKRPYVPDTKPGFLEPSDNVFFLILFPQVPFPYAPAVVGPDLTRIDPLDLPSRVEFRQET